MTETNKTTQYKTMFFVGKPRHKTIFFPDFNELVNHYMESDEVMDVLWKFAKELKQELFTTATIADLLALNIDDWMEEALNECGYVIYRREVPIETE